MKMSGRDRISELPCVILGEILSHLDMKQVVQTCILSKQWHHLWLSVPTLNFNRSMWMLREEKNAFKILTKTVPFIEFVNQVLNSRFRSHYNTIQKFRLSNMDVNDSLLLDKWITSAALLSAEELHLDNISINPIPNPVLGNIKTLRLTSVFLGCDPLSNSVSLVLENVENLMIEECVLELQAINVNRKLVIDAPLLKHLVVKHKRIWFCIRDYQFVIDAPSLNSMMFIGYDMFMDYHFRNMSSLVSADFQVEFPNDVRIEVDVVTNCWKNILRGVSNARCLALSASTFQVSLELPDLLKRSRNSFDNLKFLKLTQWCKDDHIVAMLLELFPCVEKLILEGSKKSFGGRMNIGDWGEQSSFQCILSHLKTVEIRNLEGCEDELKFLEFIMRNATVLEKIIIKETKFVSANKEKMLVEFAEKLQLLSIPYSSVVITLMVKVKRI